MKKTTDNENKQTAAPLDDTQAEPTDKEDTNDRDEEVDQLKAQIEELKAELAEKDGESAPTHTRKVPERDDGEEYVTIELFKDSGKYKDDVLVCVNGESCLIKRGVPVRIKKKFLWVIEQSRTQDSNTARLIDEETKAFENKQRIYEK